MTARSDLGRAFCALLLVVFFVAAMVHVEPRKSRPAQDVPISGVIEHPPLYMEDLNGSLG